MQAEQPTCEPITAAATWPLQTVELGTEPRWGGPPTSLSLGRVSFALPCQPFRILDLRLSYRNNKQQPLWKHVASTWQAVVSMASTWSPNLAGSLRSCAGRQAGLSHKTQGTEDGWSKQQQMDGKLPPYRRIRVGRPGPSVFSFI